MPIPTILEVNDSRRFGRLIEEMENIPVIVEMSKLIAIFALVIVSLMPVFIELKINDNRRFFILLKNRRTSQ